MAEVIRTASLIPVPGDKVIAEYVGRVRTGSANLSVARMQAPPGWTEPPQTPEFDEVTLVLTGVVVVEVGGERLEIGAGEAILTRAGERVQFSVGPDGADYVAVCVPAFAPDLAHRDGESAGPAAG